MQQEDTPMPYLKIINNHGQSVSITHALEKEIVVIGRRNADMVIDEDASISSQHAKIRKSGARYLISDLGSKNGTYLNNKLLRTETPLSAGDHIRIGQAIMVYLDEATEPGVGSIVVGAEDSQFQGTMFKADQIANTMVAEDAQRSGPAVREHLLLLIELSKDVMNISDEQTLATILTQRLLAWFSVDCCAIVYPRVVDDYGYELDTLSISWSTPEPSRDITISRTAVNQALENKMASITANAMQDDRFMAQQSIIARGISSILCVPLWHEEQIFGLLYMDTANPQHQLDLDHLGLLSAVANIAAIKITQLRLFADVLVKTEIEKELELAGEIQAGLLPGEYYTFNDIVCVGFLQACLEIGGDYYDFIPLSDDVLTVTIADVTGHGPPSALLMVACQSMLTVLIETGVPFNERVDYMNRYLVKHSTSTQFITFFHAEIDPRTRTMRYCNAGHNPPILIPDVGDIQTLSPDGPPLGIIEMPYTIETVAFDRKAKLVMYTDGITEAANPAGDLYEEARLLELVTRQRTQSAEDLKTTIMESVEHYSSGTEYVDDVTLSIIEQIR